MSSPEDMATLLGLIGLFCTGIGLFYAGWQLRLSQKIARGEFLLHLDELFQQHQGIHVRLRPGGDYYTGECKPTTAEDWVAIEQYMGLFERIKMLVDDRIIDLDTIHRIYGYRVSNIVGNDTIRQVKLEQEKQSWRGFIELWQDLEKKR
ncbi:MAG: hypothetical protein IT328_23845 [Caldilineaceae bacterium]|nr:hypothetical protein [Caldilineaceae bacterium]